MTTFGAGAAINEANVFRLVALAISKTDLLKLSALLVLRVRGPFNNL